MALTKISRGLLDTGVSDSSDSTAITIDSSERVQIGSTGITSTIDSTFHAHQSVDGDAIYYLFNDTQSSSSSTNETTQLYLGWRDAATGVAVAPRIVAGKEGDFTTAGNADSFLAFHTSADNTLSEKLRIQSGGGISFNGDTAAANALDDYEEGQWTPTIQGSTGAGTYTYGTNHGEYMKVGNIVVANFRIDQIGVSSAGSGNIEIHGFPFTAKATTLQYYWGSVILEYFDTAPSTVALSVGVKDPGTHALIWESRDTTTNGVVSITDINNTSNADIWGQVTYMT